MILIVEDRESLRGLLRRALEGEGYSTREAPDCAAAFQHLDRRHFDLVLTDLKLPDGTGLEVLATSRRLQAQTPVLVMTAYGTVHTAVEAMKGGAFDFLEKPVEVDDLLELVSQAIGPREGEGHYQPPGGPIIVGRSPQIQAALRLLKRVSVTESTVLLTGESGTGKELFAQCLHVLSPRSAGPFVAINCAALPEALMENELFGQEKGAFTGADRRQAGRFERAHGGTLFLDEIGELPLGLQAKVLRVLDEGIYERVGGGSPQKSNARLVAATNRNLGAMVKEGSFRADLFYRLEVFPISIPPLRERLEDLDILSTHLLRSLAKRHGRPAPTLSAKALKLLGDHSWPGNIRELGNLLERVLILAEGDLLREADLTPFLHTEIPPDDPEAELRQVLLSTGGEKHKAAEILGVSYSTLQRRILQYDLEGFPKYRD